MNWEPYYSGDGIRRNVKLPQPPPWRTFPSRSMGNVFQAPEGLTQAVNAALHLRRPLLLTGEPGSGKSSVIDSVANELNLGTVLRWHITSRSVLDDAIYRYDVLGRVHAQQVAGDYDKPSRDDITGFLQLGPLGTALLPGDKPRALLIDEFDKGDFDLPGDLLDILERGEYEIKELARHRQSVINIREWASEQTHAIERGKVVCSTFPVIIITSNGERDFPAPFLRRCVRFQMPKPTPDFVARIIAAHLGKEVSDSVTSKALIATYVQRVASGELIALDQLLNAIYLLTGANEATAEQRNKMQEILMRELSRA